MTVLTIARHTLHEAFSRRLVLAALGLSLIFLALCGLGFLFLYGKLLEGPKSSEREVAVAAAVLTVLGLYAVNFLSSLLALFLAVGAVSAEVESGTLQAVLARPIRRSAFVVGRWLAHALLIALYVTLMTAAPLLLARLIAGYEAPDPLRAGALMLLSALVLLTLSLLGSTRLPTLANGQEIHDATFSGALNAVPVPASWVLLATGSGLAGLVGLIRRRRLALA